MSLRRAIGELRGSALPEPEAPPLPAHLPEPRIRQLERHLGEREEADLCDVLAEWLRGNGWEVFFEVPLGQGRPDVVAFRHDSHLAIEAKLVDVPGVIKQGLRIAARVDSPYIALPPLSAGEAGVALARLERDRPGLRLPGLLAVGAEVHELRPPSSLHPRRRAAAADLRAAAERYGTERGGVPSTDQMVRNTEIWRERAAGVSVAELSETFRLSETGVRSVISRLRQWRDHLESCDDLPCLASGKSNRTYFAGSHKHAELLRALPTIA